MKEELLKKLTAELVECQEELASMEDNAAEEDSLWDDRDFLAAYNNEEGAKRAYEHSISIIRGMK